MATTITQSFLKLKENLEITQLQTAITSTRQSEVRKVMENGLEVIDSFLTGSYIRNTMIAPLQTADIDIFIVLNSKYFNNYNNGQNGGQAGLLDLVKRILQRTYTRTPKISRNGQAVSINFSDFVVDVVPAFLRVGDGYLIPSSTQKLWIETNPKFHVHLMSNENIAHNGLLVPVVKMIKCWNRNINQSFVSFYLELMAINIFKNLQMASYPENLRFFFDKGREAIKYLIKDPVWYGGNINGLQNISTVSEAVSRFESAYIQSCKAVDYAIRGYIQAAIEEWQKIFGNYFPAFG